MINEDSVMPVGHIFKPHSYKGELNFDISLDADIFNDPKNPFFIKVDNIFVPFFVEYLKGGPDKKSYIKFKDIDSDTAADLFVNQDLFTLKSLIADSIGVPEEDLDLMAEDFIGYHVIDDDSNELIGMVEDIEEGIEYDYLSVKRTDSGQNLSIPFIDEFIKEIVEGNEEEPGKIIVKLPDGFLDI